MKSTLLPALGAMVVISLAAFATETAEVKISISESGAIAIGGQNVTLQELAHHLAKIAAEKQKPELRIIFSDKAPLKLVREILDVCEKSGLLRSAPRLAGP